MREYNGEKYIVSFTSFGKRLGLTPKMVYCLLRQTYRDIHLVLTLYREDATHIPDDLQLLVDNDLLEILVADGDLGPHLKYFYVMKKYWDRPIITVDDDRYYSNDLVENLVGTYETLEYKSVVANRAIKMGKSPDGRMTVYPEWIRRKLKPLEKSYIAMAEGFSGILYPARCFSGLDGYVDDILRCKYDDDLLLRVFETRERIPVTGVRAYGNINMQYDFHDMMQYNLHNNINREHTNRQNMCRLYEAELLEGWSL